MHVPQGLIGDSKHTTFTCPHCGVLSMHTKIIATPGFLDRRYIDNSGGGGVWYHAQYVHFIVRCVNCQKDTYLYYRPDCKCGTQIHPDSPRAQLLHQYPVYTPAHHKSVPVGVRDAALEAEKCLSVGAANACGVMTRRAMHSLCEDKQAQGKDLFDQLTFLRDKHYITPDLWQWSEELRVLGKHGAHPEWEEVTDEDAEYGVKFLREIVKYVYILPYERSERRIKETSKKA